jgi:hypothetical protein
VIIIVVVQKSWPGIGTMRDGSEVREKAVLCLWAKVCEEFRRERREFSVGVGAGNANRGWEQQETRISGAKVGVNWDSEGAHYFAYSRRKQPHISFLPFFLAATLLLLPA